jgi:hypothetical protein
MRRFEHRLIAARRRGRGRMVCVGVFVAAWQVVPGRPSEIPVDVIMTTVEENRLSAASVPVPVDPRRAKARGQSIKVRIEP